MKSRVILAGDGSSLALRLREQRSLRRLSQRKLARELGVSRDCYARYELGSRSPPGWFVAKAAAYYQISIDDLYQNSEVKKKE